MHCKLKKYFRSCNEMSRCFTMWKNTVHSQYNKISIERKKFSNSKQIRPAANVINIQNLHLIHNFSRFGFSIRSRTHFYYCVFSGSVECIQLIQQKRARLPEGPLNAVPVPETHDAQPFRNRRTSCCFSFNSFQRGFSACEFESAFGFN